MDTKAVVTAYAKSKTTWGGMGLYGLNFLLVLMSSDRPHTISIGFDGAPLVSFPLTGPVLFVLASVCLWLCLYGRGVAAGPLFDVLSQAAATARQGEEKQ